MQPDWINPGTPPVALAEAHARPSPARSPAFAAANVAAYGGEEGFWGEYTIRAIADTRQENSIQSKERSAPFQSPAQT
jgi:hypothetical protein